MGQVVEEFERRAAEVRKFIRMLARMEQPETELEQGSPGEQRAIRIDEEWLRVGKAAAYLMLYNVVEASLRSAFAELYGTIRSEKLKHGLISKAVRQVWIEQRHRRVSNEDAAPKNYLETAKSLIEDVVVGAVVELDPGRLPGAGSLDAKRIRQILDKHGCQLVTNPRARGGDALSTVKRLRNHLAHGQVSFSECGRDVAIRDLVQVARETRLFMRGVLTSLENYASQKAYATTQR